MVVKKAEGLSLQTIAVAAIVLVVIIVVFAIFKGGIDRVQLSINKANECDNIVGPNKEGYGCEKGGECTQGVEIYGLGCPEKNKETPYCCKKG